MYDIWNRLLPEFKEEHFMDVFLQIDDRARFISRLGDFIKIKKFNELKYLYLDKKIGMLKGQFIQDIWKNMPIDFQNISIFDMLLQIDKEEKGEFFKATKREVLEEKFEELKELYRDKETGKIGVEFLDDVWSNIGREIKNENFFLIVNEFLDEKGNISKKIVEKISGYIRLQTFKKLLDKKSETISKKDIQGILKITNRINKSNSSEIRNCSSQIDELCIRKIRGRN